MNRRTIIVQALDTIVQIGHTIIKSHNPSRIPSGQLVGFLFIFVTMVTKGSSRASVSVKKEAALTRLLSWSSILAVLVIFYQYMNSINVGFSHLLHGGTLADSGSPPPLL
jgi:hypothetical protein